MHTIGHTPDGGSIVYVTEREYRILEQLATISIKDRMPERRSDIVNMEVEIDIAPTLFR